MRHHVGPSLKGFWVRDTMLHGPSLNGFWVRDYKLDSSVPYLFSQKTSKKHFVLHLLCSSGSYMLGRFVNM